MNSSFKKNIKSFVERGPLFIFLSAISFLILPCLAFAADYELLEPLPIVGDSVSESGFGGYLSGMFKLSIGIAIVLAVFQLSRGGFTYLTTEAFTGKSNARGIINNALIGLVLALTAFIILEFINPDLVNVNFEIPSPSDISR